ncbi:Transglutaminase-like superfamily protein [Microbacterium sp. ru370.1]|uniref:transglutaminase domain-containing protein n=1 Tax=unclassified Microbacterium TaxID=2609290 RepID=UPI00089105D5|nr:MULTISPECIES: transglutaminase domain-containing protein [unclassified Microbacterium]SDO44592.1 Transglutaminase-like superfamily protein [Microbacterium sp. ru370.1]SIT81030.1 Transglutaminase-like superfamily protein [Microbacterium sp. RU1D]
MSGPRERASRRRREASSAPRWIAAVVYTAVSVALAAVAAWPIYAAASFIVLVVAASVTGAGLVALVAWRRGSGWALAAGLVAAFTLLAVPLAVPSRLTSPLDVLRGLGESYGGVVVAWKDLVTVDLPVGAYRNLLIPALVVFLVGTALALSLAARSDRQATAAVVAGLGMTGFGLFFGRTSTSAPLPVGPLVLSAPVETLVGISALLSAVLWLAWRAHDERARALRRASDVSAVQVGPGRSRTDRRRGALGVAMIATAVLATVAVVPWVARGADREVLRSAAGPDRQIAEAVSPLAQYRAMFSDARADEVLFRVSGEGTLPERIRLATLDAYDGEIFRASGDEGSGFVRLPSTRDAGEGRSISADIEIADLEGIWMPTAGRLASARFEGDRRGAMADRFYYSADAEAGVQTADGGLRAGDRYELAGVEPAPVDLASLTPPGAPQGVSGGDNLQRWVEEHATGSDGVALQALVQLLRERGYLSHSLAPAGAAVPAWAADLPGYQLQPSASGHSLARIDRMFERLLDREDDPRAASTGNYVAAVGDDEQFAVATALIARELGFPARVVVGTRLVAADPTLSACDAGECRPRDLTAWTEVQGTDGRWATIDVTPQWEQSPSLEVTQQRDPENVTEVRPDTVEEVVPPEPVQEDDSQNDGTRSDDGLDLAWLWPVLRIAGIGLLVVLVLFGPFLAVVIAKAVRRRGRRRDPDARSAIAGGWDEYVDAGLDAGRSVPRAPTRREVAEAFATPSGIRLAADADRAVFAADDVTADEVAAFWRIVDDERRVLTRQRGFWRRVRAAVSLRSFLRFLAPRPPRRGSPHRDERGKRPATTARRDTT